jgi:hypothetical protein
MVGLSLINAHGCELTLHQEAPTIRMTASGFDIYQRFFSTTGNVSIQQPE